jgi:uncharacterized protein
MLFGKLLPREGNFFELFNEHGGFILEGARAFQKMIENYNDPALRQQYADEVDKAEHAADRVTAEVNRLLHRTFITPIDREDISHLASSLDDVIDWIEEVGRRLRLYRIEQPTPIARRFSTVILEQAEQIARAVPLLEERSQAEVLRAATQEIHRLENEGDDLLADAIATLYDGVTEVPQLIQSMRWNDLYQLLEDTTDKAENVATVLNTIALKNA